MQNGGDAGGYMNDFLGNEYNELKNAGRIITMPSGMIYGGYEYYKRQKELRTLKDE